MFTGIIYRQSQSCCDAGWIEYCEELPIVKLDIVLYCIDIFQMQSFFKNTVKSRQKRLFTMCAEYHTMSSLDAHSQTCTNNRFSTETIHIDHNISDSTMVSIGLITGVYMAS